MEQNLSRLQKDDHAAQVTSEPYDTTWKSVAIQPPRDVSYQQRSFDWKVYDEKEPHLKNIGQKLVNLNTIWNVSKDSLRCLPTSYRLDPRVVFLCSADLTAVTERIVDANREMNVYAQYDGEKANAKLLTNEGVEIVINLFRAKALQDGKDLIVEVQRQFGCSVSFHRYCRCILEAACGTLENDDIDNIIHPHIPLRELDMEDGENKESTIEALQLTNGLIKKDTYDAIRIGYESLSTLTDISKSNKETAIRCSRAVLFNEDFNIKLDIQRNVVESLLNRNILDEDKIPIYDEDEDRTDSFNFRHYWLQNRALLIISNSLETISTISIDELTDDIEMFLVMCKEQSIFLSLCKNLEACYEMPHNAHLSAKILRILVSSFPSALNMAQSMELHKYVQCAYEFGVVMHSALADECSKLLTFL